MLGLSLKAWAEIRRNYLLLPGLHFNSGILARLWSNVLQRRCWKPNLARVKYHFTLQYRSISHWKVLGLGFFGQPQFWVNFRAGATSQIHRWHWWGHVFSLCLPSSEFGIQAWSLLCYWLQKATTIKCWTHNYPRPLPRAEEQPCCCFWAVGYWTSAHSHRLLCSHKKGVQAHVVGLSSGVGPRMSISGAKVGVCRVGGTCPSSSALPSFEPALSWVEQIHGQVPAPFPTPSALNLDRISQFPVCRPKAPVSDVGLKHQLWGTSVIPWLVVLPSSCCHGYSSPTLKKNALFGFRALPFPAQKHSSHPHSHLFLNARMTKPWLFLPLRCVMASALTRISAAPAPPC